MMKSQRNDVGSLVLDRASGGNFRLWPAFSGAAFRRKLVDTMRCGVSRYRREEQLELKSPIEKNEKLQKSEGKKNDRSERLSELLNLEGSEAGFDEAETETRKKVEVFEELRGVVKRLQFEEGGKGAQRDAATDVRRLAKEDAEARGMLAMLGAIPPLVGMLDSVEQDLLIAALYALLNLAIGNDMNKEAIVKAGAIHKMLKLFESPSIYPEASEAIVANFLGLSALDSNKPIIGASGAIPYLANVLQNLDNNSSSQSKQDALRALFNLSISPANISQILESGLVPFLMSTLGDMQVSERILSILSNVVSAPEGRKAIGNCKDAFPILVDVLNWTDSPCCQEKATYILMVMAYKAYGDRQAMSEAGMVSSLLELTLLGSTLAQKRASRILECLRVDKGKQVSEGYGGRSGAAVSEPLCGSSSSSAVKRDLKGGFEGVEEEDTMSEEKKAVNRLVQQSLQNNMRRIAKRANLPQDFAPSEHFKALAGTSTSKSLPF